MFQFHSSGAFLLFLITILTFNSCINSQATYSDHRCLGPGNGTMDAEYKSNLTSLLGYLASEASLYSFFDNISHGAYGLFLCRGDVSNDTCKKCVSIATATIRTECPDDKQAIIWFDECMIRYANYSFFGIAENDEPIKKSQNGNTEPDIDAQDLMYQLVRVAPDTKLMFKADKIAVRNGSEWRYGLVQCTRDIGRNDCSNCLTVLTNSISSCCQGQGGWQILASSCYMRYERYSFFNESQLSPPQPAPATPQLSSDHKGINTVIIAVIIVSSIVAVAVIFGISYALCLRRRRRMRDGETNQQILSQITDLKKTIFNTKEDDSSGEMQYFNLSTIQAATDNFSDANQLGEGGFGPVYKGKLENEKEIAVKRLSLKSRQGGEQFKNEVLVIAKLQHRNLVRLVGFCSEGEEKLLVYEYMPNRSLDAYLFDPEKSKELDWDMRENVINGIAKGLLYLHEDSRLKIIHRDLKVSNILLDEEMKPKISDFGMARIFYGNQIEAETNVVVGTCGYLAPEYALEGLFSTKSDVYSFGVVILEIISGKKNNPKHQRSLLSLARHLWHEGKGEELIDKKIFDSCNISEALRCIHIALLCIQEEPADRPTASTIVLMLGSKLID